MRGRGSCNFSLRFTYSCYILVPEDGVSRNFLYYPVLMFSLLELWIFGGVGELSGLSRIWKFHLFE